MPGGYLKNPGDWSTDGNWSTGTKPGDGNDAVIPGSLGSNVTMSGDEKAVEVALLDVDRNFQHLFGTSGAPLKCGVDLLKVYGSTGFYFSLHDDGATGHTCERADIWARNPQTPVELGSEAAALDAFWSDIRAIVGQLLLKNTIKWTASTGILRVMSSGANVRLAASGPTLPILEMSAGELKSDVRITTARLFGGEWTQDTEHVDTVDIFGGQLILNDEAAGGDGTVIRIHPGGTLDLLRDYRPKTINKVELFKGGTLLYDEDVHVITTLIDHTKVAA